MITCIFEDGGEGKLRHVVIDALVLKDDKILMVRRAKELLEGGKWGIIGGFVNRDENTKQAVEREVFEETGYKIRNIQLLTVRDNPNRPHEDRQNISFVYICEAKEKEGEADWESSERKWFSVNEVPKPEEIAFDHYENIKLFLRSKKNICHSLFYENWN